MAQHPAGSILLVDDEPNFLMVLAALLRYHGYTVATAADGALAWAHLQRQPYDVILCDLLMPQVDGQAFYARLQQYASPLCTRVIFLTGDRFRPTTKTFLEQCGRPFLYKPCSADDVLDAIEQVLRVPARLRTA